MSFHLLSLPAADAERLAYAEGFTGTATLFARIDDLQRALGAATAELTDLQRRIFESDEQTDAARIERAMETERANIASRNADVLFAAMLDIARGCTNPRKIANDALETIE